MMIWRYPVTVESGKDGDFTYHLINISLITMLELWLGIIVACIPTLGPILNRYGQPALTRIINTFRSSSGSGGSNGKQSSGVSIDVKMASLQQRGTDGQQFNNYAAEHSWSELNDSTEAINGATVNKHSYQQPYTRNADVPAAILTAEDKTRSKLSVVHGYHDDMPTYLGSGQSGTMTDIAVKPRPEFATNYDKALPQGVIYVQRDFSSTNEVSRGQGY